MNLFTARCLIINLTFLFGFTSSFGAGKLTIERWNPQKNRASSSSSKATSRSTKLHSLASWRRSPCPDLKSYPEAPPPNKIDKHVPLLPFDLSTDLLLVGETRVLNLYEPRFLKVSGMDWVMVVGGSCVIKKSMKQRSFMLTPPVTTLTSPLSALRQSFKII